MLRRCGTDIWLDVVCSERGLLYTLHWQQYANKWRKSSNIETCNSRVQPIKNKCVISYSYLCMMKMWHYPHLLLHTVLWSCAAVAQALHQSTDISYLPGPQQQTHRMLLQQENGTGGWTPYRFIDPALHTMQAVPINTKQNETHTLRVKKQDTKVLPVTSPNINWFSNLSHWQTQ